jgi:protein SCO1/2
MRPWLAVAALALACLLAEAGCGGHAQTAARAPDFELRDQDGKLVQLAAEREHGRVVFVTFLYTHCRDVCPIIAKNLDETLRKLGPARESVRVLAVSVDPRGDTFATVRAYIREKHLLPEFRYLVGTKPQLQPVWKAYGIPVTPQSLETIDHVATVLLVDRNGRIRARLPAAAPPKDLLHAVRTLLR